MSVSVLHHMQDRANMSQSQHETVRKGITRSRQTSRASPQPAVKPAALSVPETARLKSAKLGLGLGLLVGALDEVGCHRGATGVLLSGFETTLPLLEVPAPLARSTRARYRGHWRLRPAESPPFPEGLKQRLPFSKLTLSESQVCLPPPSWHKRWGSHCPEPLIAVGLGSQDI